MNTDLILILDAASFAADKHRLQRRKDAEASPYINHPLALADILAREGGVEDAIVIAAALLHDTVEDTETSIEELETRFGKPVASMVAEVTDDKSLPKQERKLLQITNCALKSPGAKLVKLADQIANLRDLASAPPASWSDERRAEYFDWARRVAEGLRGTNASLEAAFDEAYAKGLGTARTTAQPDASKTEAKTFSRRSLTMAGFTGWMSFSEARNCDQCPRTGGVYVVRYDGSDPPKFSKKSCGGWFKDRDPSVSQQMLSANWVDGAETIYIGKADELRRRIKQFADFGAGKPVGHWGGRLIWHLPNPDRLQIAWVETPGQSPLQAEAELIAQFRDAYGKPPFANNPQMLGK